MGKISQVAAKYIIHADLKIEGIVDKPDIIGAEGKAIFNGWTGKWNNLLRFKY